MAWIVGMPMASLPSRPSPPADLTQAAGKLDALVAARWAAAGVEPAADAGDLTILRRLTLALVGSVPSTEELREFEADTGSDRLQRWTARLIADRRFVEYLGAKFAAAFIDSGGDDLKPHQQMRFAVWLGEAIQNGRGYDELAREIVSGQGVFADRPATTFVAAELAAGDEAAQRLAARTSRVLLAQRIDCAQCHDHPFADWTQDQFEGLAAHYGQARFRNALVLDTNRGPFVIDDTRAGLKRDVEPAVPFEPGWAPTGGLSRERLAEWVTHPENRYFRRAIANRVWGLMTGRPLVTPVDDLPAPGAEPDALDLLGDDLAAHGYDLRRMIHLIVASRPFQLDSAHPGLDTGDQQLLATLERTQAVFPVTELDADQLFRSMNQAASARTIRPETASSYAIIRRIEAQFRFRRDYGDKPAEAGAETSDIPEAVQRLSGYAVQRMSRAEISNALGRLALAATTEDVVERSFLACLTRPPTAEERAYFLQEPARNVNRRGQLAEDIYWTLFNGAEFCWNH